MRIVLLDKKEGSEGINGVEVYNERFVEYLVAQGHEVFILRFTNEGTEEANVTSLSYHLGPSKTFFIIIPSVTAIIKIYDYLRKLKPDIVYMCIGLSPWDMLLPSLCHQLHIPLAGIWHADFNTQSRIYKYVLKPAFTAYLPFCKSLDLLHVFSPILRDYYVKKGVSEDKIIVLPNGIDSSFYSPGRSLFAKKHTIKQGILLLGRLTYQKNPELAFKSFLKVNPPPHVKLVVVGNGDLTEKLKAKYKDERIIFTGLITDEKKKLDIIRACSIFIQPSRFEGVSLALLEAMACGLACIASDIGSNRTLLKDSGIVVPNLNLENEISESLQVLLDSPDYMTHLGDKARKRIIQYYEQEKIFTRLEKALKRTVTNYNKNKQIPKEKLLDFRQYV